MRLLAGLPSRRNALADEREIESHQEWLERLAEKGGKGDTPAQLRERLLASDRLPTISQGITLDWSRCAH